MSEKLRGLAFLEQKYNLNFKDKQVLHQGKSLFENVLNTNLGIDAKQLLSKKHALDFQRGLTPGNERAIKDIKSFNSHVPDILRRLDFYMADENKGIMPSDVMNEYEIDKVEETQNQKITQEQKQGIVKTNEIFEKKLEELPTDEKELKSIKSGTGKVRKLFQRNDGIKNEPEKQNEPSVIGLEEDKLADEPQKHETSTNLTKEQEQTLEKFKNDNNDKTSGLLILNKNGEIIKNYDSLEKFKSDKENYNNFKKDIVLSKRKVGVSFINENNGDVLYFVPKSKYREIYPTHTFISRNKKKFKKIGVVGHKKDDDGQQSGQPQQQQ